MLKHSDYEGFKGFFIKNEEENVVGFIYGYTSLPGQYYNTLLKKELTAEEQNVWLSDCFELVELAVHPDYRKQGFGRVLVKQLLECVENRTALLTTQVNNDSARNLYTKLGWRIIKEPFFPSNENTPFVIMGIKV